MRILIGCAVGAVLGVVVWYFGGNPTTASTIGLPAVGAVLGTCGVLLFE